MSGVVSDVSSPASPDWAFSLAAAALSTGLVCWPAWPGFMSYDSLFAYEQGREGVTTMLWPPLHAYLFKLAELLHVGPGGLFAAQTFVLFASAAVVLNMLIGRKAAARLAFLGFAASFVYVPGQLGVLLSLWRDVPTASLTLLGLALWLLARRTRWPALIVLSVAAIGAAVALRYNAFVLAAPLLALIVWAPFGDVSPDGRRPAVLAVMAFLTLAWASTQWRLPDLLYMPQPQNFAATQEFDLIGVSACADRNLLPPGVTAGQAITPYQIRAHYDPRHLQLSLQDKPGLPTILESDADGAVQRAWRETVPRQLPCYLAHRTLVFTEQMGLAAGGLFYPVHARIDPNRFGLTLAHPGAAKSLQGYIERNAPELWRRPFLLYLFALGALAAGLVTRAPHRLLTSALMAGALAYPALLFVAAPAADARYIFPSNVLCALLISLVVGQVIAGVFERRAAAQALASTEP